MSFRVLFLVGSTASGKSQVALELAEKHNGVIVNCDSIQVYKELSIGAAKPSLEDFKRVPHFLYDFISYPHKYTAGDFTRDFSTTIEQIKNDYSFAIVVGGTGFYFQAIEKGMFEAGKADPLIMEKIKLELTESDGPERLYAELLKVDSESAKVIHFNDHYRLQRALGVWRTLGKSMSQLRSEMEQKAFQYPLQKFGIKIEKSELEKRIRQRAEIMLKSGLIEEVKELLKKNYLTWAPLQSVGYRETIDFLQGRMANKNELIEAITISTRQLAKRQRTWFQRDAQIIWVEPNSAVKAIEAAMSGV